MTNWTGPEHSMCGRLHAECGLLTRSDSACLRLVQYMFLVRPNPEGSKTLAPDALRDPGLLDSIPPGYERGRFALGRQADDPHAALEVFRDGKTIVIPAVVADRSKFGQ
jgi:hypothetical protein